MDESPHCQDGEHLEEVLDDIYVGDCVCALCDEGGDLLCCEGGCMRAFHATVDAGTSSQCVTLRMDQRAVKQLSSWSCPNCVAMVHQCFVCGELGSSVEGEEQEVFQCGESGCGHHYHLSCLAQVVCSRHEESDADSASKAEEYRRQRFFRCPLHFCADCGELEKSGVHNWLVKCRRCPTAYHVECLPFGLRYGKTDASSGVYQRVWGVDDEFPQRVMYCSQHPILPVLETPSRDHIVSPHGHSFGESDELEPVISQSRPARQRKFTQISKKGDSEASRGTGKSKGENARKRRRESYSCLLEPTPSNVAEPLASTSSRITELEDGASAKGNFASQPSKSESDSSSDLRRLVDAAANGRASVSSRQASRVDRMSDHKPNESRPSTPAELERLLSNDQDNTDDDLGNDSVDHETLLSVTNLANRLWTIEKVDGMLSVPMSYGRHDADRPSNFIKRREIRSLLEKLPKNVDSALNVLQDPTLPSKTAHKQVVEMLRPESLTQLEALESHLAVRIAPFLHGRRYTSFGRHFTASEKLEEIIKRLHWYIDDGDVVVDTSCGSNEWSTLLASTLEKQGKRHCQFKNFDICETSNPFHFEKKDWFEVSKDDLPSGKNLVFGLNPPFGQLGERAKDFVERMFTFEPRLVILIAPKAAEVDNPRYELLWKDTELLKGQAFYLPGSTDEGGNVLPQHNNDPPPLYLYGRKDHSDKHHAITVKHNLLQIASGQLPPMTQTKLPW